MVRTICPSPPMRTKALGVNGGLATLWAASAAPMDGPALKPMRRPPPTAALTVRKRRRDRSTPSPSTRSIIRWEVMSGPLLGARHKRRALDSLADARIGSAATDVSRHRGVDVGVARLRHGGEQRRGGHDLPGLAIAALRHVQLDPGLLNLLAGRRGANGLDRGDALPGHGGDR